MTYVFDILIIGGGHAGVEAALIARKMGRQVGLVSLDHSKTGRMSCNPAIGGMGKTHIAREVDALGGYIAEATDLAGIQFRVLNRKKGPAVQATRAQTDKDLYEKIIQKKLKEEGVVLINDEIIDFKKDKNEIISALSKNNEYSAKSYVLTTGTFLNGSILIGHEKNEGGRINEKKSSGLELFFNSLNLKTGRLKTGTPPRLDKQTVDFGSLEEQPGDSEKLFMSYLGAKNKHPKQTSCHITYTNKKTHEIIRKNIKKSAMYSGLISGVGPRYCPSIEDKIMRFEDKDQHQVFVEPEGLKANTIYPNGISTSLPKEIQEEYIRSIKGFENAKITQFGYAVEYDYIDPRNLDKTLRVKKLKNLFLAGQINGTTGYEEAAGQGMVAGINASLLLDEDSWMPKRQDSYLGVLVDDLTRFGVSEPYRMFTSRAEHRLLLRQDNADERMFKYAKKFKTLDKIREEVYLKKQSEKNKARNILERTKIDVGGKKRTGTDLCKRNDFSLKDLSKITKLKGESFKQTYFDIRYSGYIKKQQRELEKIKNLEEFKLGLIFDYKEVIGLSGELQEKLNHHKPKDLQEVANIEGITPAAISVLTIHLKKIDAIKTSY